MNVHKDARTTARGRLLPVARACDHGLRVEGTALAAAVPVRTAHKCLAWHQAGGELAVHDRSSAPDRLPGRLPANLVVEIERLRRRRLTRTQTAQFRRSSSSAGLVLRRHDLGCLTALEPRPPVLHYQRAPGELLHIDTKKLARLAYSEVLPDERNASALVDHALSWFRRHCVVAERIMTDNREAYRSHDFRRACSNAELRPKSRPSASSKPPHANGPMPGLRQIRADDRGSWKQRPFVRPCLDSRNAQA
jgi:transposase InsO family protein